MSILVLLLLTSTFFTGRYNMVVETDEKAYKAFTLIYDVWEVVASSDDPDALLAFMDNYYADDYYEIVGW
jgi:hypothetical protein